jgi:hypothetical protein
MIWNGDYEDQEGRSESYCVGWRVLKGTTGLTRTQDDMGNGNNEPKREKLWKSVCVCVIVMMLCGERKKKINVLFPIHVWYRRTELRLYLT